MENIFMENIVLSCSWIPSTCFATRNGSYLSN